METDTKASCTGFQSRFCHGIESQYKLALSETASAKTTIQKPLAAAERIVSVEWDPSLSVSGGHVGFVLVASSPFVQWVPRSPFICDLSRRLQKVEIRCT